MIIICFLIFLCIFILFVVFYTQISFLFPKKLETYIQHDNKTKKLYFIHIPKAGGTFIENYLEQSNQKLGRLDTRYPDTGTKIECSQWHVPPKYKSSLDFRELKPFTVIRHPVSRIISEYCYQKTYLKDKISYSTINDFVMKELHDGNFKYDCHLTPQVDYVHDQFGNECETFLRFENLENDLRWFCRLHHIPEHNKNIPRLKSKSFVTEKDLSKESKERILTFYQKDVELWKRASTNVIYMYWGDGFEKAPEVVQLCRMSWKIMNPTWVFVELDDKNLSDHISDMSFLEKYKSKMSINSYSDLIRLFLLKEHGGVWVDATVFCQKPLNEWLHKSSPGGFFAFAFSHPSNKISSWFLYAHRKSAIIEKWFKETMKYWEQGNNDENYFWLHDLFNKCYHNDESFRKEMDKMVHLDANPPHEYQRKQYLNPKTHLQKLSLKKKMNLSPFYEILFQKKKN